MISGKSTNMELFYVTRLGFNGKPYEYLATRKELQSELTRASITGIVKIEKAIITKGEEVDFEYLKPAKYKGKAWTYVEKYS